ncbi:MAG: FtsX-like permease family protein [Planctomycetota bacterium]
MTVRALTTKLLRDGRQGWLQYLSIALVLGLGIALQVGMHSTMTTLADAQARYYAATRFGDAWCSLVRAPLPVADALRAIDGIAHVEPRLLGLARLDLPGVTESVQARLLSLPRHGEPAINGLRLMRGRWPEPGRDTEALLLDTFAAARGLQPGDTLRLTVRGRAVATTIVGLVRSPENVYVAAPGGLFPDDRRFGVAWLRRDALAAWTGRIGAFDEVSLRLAPGAELPAVLAAVDRVLAPYGGMGAYGRKDHPSHFFVANELLQLRTFATWVPLAFLLAAAFLVHVVLGRLVLTQRGAIAVLKALGYRDGEVARHYLALAGGVAALGALLGLAGGAWLGDALTGAYAPYYRFPDLAWRPALAPTLLAVGVAAAAAVLGALGPVRAVMALPPAQALRPPAPPAFRDSLLDRSGLVGLLPTRARTVARELARRPRRTAGTALGAALAVALVVLGAFAYDAVMHLLHVQFTLSYRADAQLRFVEARGDDAFGSVRALPGVQAATPLAAAAVRLVAGPRSRRTAILAVPPDRPELVPRDADLRPLAVPEDGLLLARSLAEALGVAAGDTIVVEGLTGARRQGTATVARLATTYVGAAAWMQPEALRRLLGRPAAAEGALLTIDAQAARALPAACRDVPQIAMVDVTADSLRTLRDHVESNLFRSLAFTVGFALALALGVLFNTVRIAVAERLRDFATLSVLGCRPAEVRALLVGEVAFLALVGAPLGLWLGGVFARALTRSPGFANEQFRLPLLVTPRTQALALLALAIAAVLATWAGWRRYRRLDPLAVLKAQD